MRDLYSDDESVAGDGDRLIPDGVRRLAGAAAFLGLVAGMALWSYRLGTRDAGEVPVIRAMEGPSRVQPEEPGGLRAAHQGLEVNAVLAGRPAPLPRAPAPQPASEPLAPEDGPQGQLVQSAPAVLAERVLEEAGELPVPQPDLPADFVSAAPAFAPDAADPLAPEASAPAGTRPRNRPADLVVARAKTTPVAAAAAPPAAHEVGAVTAGARLVQLGAFDSADLTRKAWSQLVARHRDLLGGKSLYVERTTANARVFYRLRVAGFADAEETRAMCEALRARGIDCIPVTLQ